MDTMVGSLDVVVGPMYSGKCLGYNTPILMYDGSIKSVQFITPDDLLMGPDSKPRRVLSISSGFGQLFSVNPSGGQPFIVNKEHILSVVVSTGDKLTIQNISVEDYMESGMKAWLYKVPVGTKRIPLPVDPYVLGVWLGCGRMLKPILINVPKTVLKYMDNIGIQTATLPIHRERTLILGDFVKYLIETYKVQRWKHIPKVFITASRKHRLKLLAGIVDVCGFFVPKIMGYEILIRSSVLATDIQKVFVSLGYRCSTERLGEKVRIVAPKCLLPCKASHATFSSIKDISVKNNNYTKYSYKTIIPVEFNIEQSNYGNYYGFELDTDGLFLLGDYTVTHNTSYLMHVLESCSHVCNCLYINHSLDNRSSGPISTHSVLFKSDIVGSINADMIRVSKLSDIPDDVLSTYSVVCIDEAQFFTDLVEGVKKMVDVLKKEVKVVGLSGDYQRKTFGHIHELLPFADSYRILSDTFCKRCAMTKKKSRALFTHRICDTSHQQVEIGATNYIPVCRECYMELNPST